ncbi:MAG: helicase-related protein [Gammaproteobacteria bacterium]|nr:helicase-related protein [Gammaproteobacteria bacterium]MDE0508975.1 helicase-related protein [Gammaproteobacteria bacterium]
MLDQELERSRIINLSKALLLGPLADDETIPSAPTDTYLTGILWPEGAPLDSIDDDEQDGAPENEDAESDAGVPGYRTFRPCSIGLTFSADLDAIISISLGSTARYVPVVQEASSNERPQRHWRREPLNYNYRFQQGDTGSLSTHMFLTPDGSEIHDPDICLHVRKRIEGDRQIITATLINKADETDDRNRNERCLFQTGLEVTALKPEGDGAIHPRPDVPRTAADEDAQSAALLYRDVVEFAVGHGVAAEWEPPTSKCVDRVATTWLPLATVKGMSAQAHPMLSKFFQEHPEAMRASWLARPDARHEVTTVLKKFVGEYGNWISNTLETSLADIPSGMQDAANRNLILCRGAYRRMEMGVATLNEHDAAWQAFVFANAAMNRQAQYDVKGEGKGPLTWRPFQLAYMLLVLTGLVKLDHKDRNCLDLLWFPTGGGKTEAYLALTAFQIFFRRLTDSGRRKSGGVDVLMRYTLRLLTVQQFQRAASLICACNEIRREVEGLGDAPISLGLYVGGEATPNRIKDARDALQDEHNGTQPRSTPRQLLNCPVCGNELPPSSYTEATDGSAIEIRCRSLTCTTDGEPIPVHTVDDYMYISPPSLIIGTIDKFAQLPRRDDIRSLFGLDSGLRPGLIIQDELHLISGPLGSMAGLYETAIDLICTEDEIRPKVIGSTATIGQASRQVRALFDRDVLQFPPSGFEASDSFFAVRDDDGPNRIYLGISSAGRSLKFALQAVTAALLQVVKHRKEAGATAKLIDPFWTAVLYFNSLRELGGAHVLVQDDIPRHMSFLASRLQDKPRNLEGDVIELSSRVASRSLPEYLDQLGVSLSESDGDPFDPLPRDVVLASNMISVGVDVSRLGLMLVTGQPKSTAEYIQASSRIGRGLHGLVLTLYNFGRPRDVSHFEHFLGYHGALYRNVEATSVTPWAPRARDKALHAVVAAAIRHLVADMDKDEAAMDFDPSDAKVQNVLSDIRARARSASEDIEGDGSALDLEGIVRKWSERSQNSRNAGTSLLYWEKKAPFGKTRPYLMTSAEEGNRPGKTGWPTPNSMRDVEPSTAFVLRLAGRG